MNKKPSVDLQSPIQRAIFRFLRYVFLYWQCSFMIHFKKIAKNKEILADEKTQL